MAKGSSFERLICRQLSLWWSKGKRDDIYWRTAGSGAMAKTRSKQQKSTYGQCGDIQAVDPIGQPLLDLISIELKRGYSKDNFANILDKPEKAAIQTYENFIFQAQTDQNNSGVKFWFLIVKRDRRSCMCYFPFELYRMLRENGADFKRVENFAILKFNSKYISKQKVFIMPFNDFISAVHPINILTIMVNL